MSLRKKWANYTGTEKRVYGTLWGIIIAVILIVVLTVVFGNPSTKSTTYSASVVNQDSIDPATLRVHGTVKNTGKYSGSPNCTIEASSPNDTYHGIDIYQPFTTLKPGETKSFNGNLTITKQGSNYITKVTINCS